MKKKLFTTILTVAVAATTLFSNTLTTNAAEQKVNPLVQQLNALTGNYIGYDMTYADKVKVLNACFASSAAMQNYTLVVEPSYTYDLTYQSGRKPELYDSSLVTKTFLYDHGNYMLDYSDSVTDKHSVDFCGPTSWYALNAMPVWFAEKEHCLEYIAANNLDANYTYKLRDWLNIYSLEQFAAVAQYTEIDGIPYLVCNFQPETAAHVGCNLGSQEKYDKNNSSLVIKIALNNYGAYSFSCDLHVFAGPADPYIPNGHFMLHGGASYTNVNTTVLPAVPANYVKVF